MQNPEYYKAWDEARTGYPWIDAIMMQLRTQARIMVQMHVQGHVDLLTASDCPFC